MAILGAITGAAALMTLGDKLTRYITEAASGIGAILDDKKIIRQINESLDAGRRAFEGYLPQKSSAAYPTILGEFFASKVLEFRCQDVLENNEYDPSSLEEVFNEAYSRYYPAKRPEFDVRGAVAEFLDTFIGSAAGKDSFVQVQEFRLRRQNLRRKYCDQVIRRYTNLDFTGVHSKPDQDTVKLEDVFIPLKVYKRIPVVDVIVEGEEEAEDAERKEPPAATYRLETVPLNEALENDRVVVLGVPGSGKTTLMRHLALSAAQKLSTEPRKLGQYRLPILITIQDIAVDLLSNRTIASLLEEHLNPLLSADLPDGYFISDLEAGRCIVLFDGLDEVSNILQRAEVAARVQQFVNQYKGNKCVITSRIAGYREIQRIPEDEFAHFTVRDFDDDQVRDFAGKWHQARGSTQAEAEAEDLVGAIDRHSKVKQLATNPLMLTIIAIVHESNTRLPNRRIQLYDECTRTLLFTWVGRRKSPPLTSVDGKTIPDREARRRLEQLAYWMHSSTPAESSEPVHVKRAQLETEMAKQLAERKKMDPDDAEAEAEHFLGYIRGHTGVLLERGIELYAFVHLTFQEYFAAWEISRRCRGNADRVWEQIHSCLHDSHWREVILLLIAELDEL